MRVNINELVKSPRLAMNISQFCSYCVDRVQIGFFPSGEKSLYEFVIHYLNMLHASESIPL